MTTKIACHEACHRCWIDFVTGGETDHACNCDTCVTGPRNCPDCGEDLRVEAMIDAENARDEPVRLDFATQEEVDAMYRGDLPHVCEDFVLPDGSCEACWLASK